MSSSKKSKTLERPPASSSLAAASSTSENKSMSLDRAKMKLRVKSGKRRSKVHAIMDKMETQSDNERLQHLLDNLQIRYKNCVFTYKASHLLKTDSKEGAGGKEKRPSRLAKLSKKITSTLERMSESVCEVVDCERDFTNCLFLPQNDETKLKEFIKENSSNVKNTFEECKFLQRESTVYEKIVFRLRKTFGIVFEFDYITSSAEINDCTFRLKDISFFSSYIQQTLVEKG